MRSPRIVTMSIYPPRVFAGMHFNSHSSSDVLRARKKASSTHSGLQCCETVSNLNNSSSLTHTRVHLCKHTLHADKRNEEVREIDVQFSPPLLNISRKVRLSSQLLLVTLRNANIPDKGAKGARRGGGMRAGGTEKKNRVAYVRISVSSPLLTI